MNWDLVHRPSCPKLIQISSREDGKITHSRSKNEHGELDMEDLG